MFRVGEPHGRITPRVEELVEWFSGIDSAKATTNLWGERWSKLVQNAMGNGVTAATGLTTQACLSDPNIRRFQIALAGEAIRVGQALGYTLEKVRGIEPEKYARANEGDTPALAEVEAALTPKGAANPRADIQRPSMAQDILKGRRTEIDAMNGFIARKGAEVGVAAPSHVKLAGIVTRIERGELKPSPASCEPTQAQSFGTTGGCIAAGRLARRFVGSGAPWPGASRSACRDWQSRARGFAHAQAAARGTASDGAFHGANSRALRARSLSFSPTGAMVNASCSCASPPSGVVTLSMSKLGEQHRHHHLHLEQREVAARAQARARRRTASPRAWPSSAEAPAEPARRIEGLRIRESAARRSRRRASGT